MNFKLLLILAAFDLACLGPQAVAAEASEPSIRVTPSEGDLWSVEYRLATPTRQLLFQRSPDDSRSQSWIAPRGFALSSTPEGEVVRRSDGQSFSIVTLKAPPVYQDLPKDYGPFAPFGDGGILFHTGRFFACPERCSDDPAWHMTLATTQKIVLDGRVIEGSAEWTDGGNGRYVYVGEQTPIDTEELVAVVDRSLPLEIRRQLDEQLPQFMHFFAQRLGELPSRPMLFASYDADHAGGWGRQGGTLPGQIFTHFYGSAWVAEMAKPDFASDLAWHFAHEAAHLYQRQISSSDRRDSWIHEGGAEVFAAMAVEASDPEASAYIESRMSRAGEQCRQTLAGRSMAEALEAGDYRTAYSCGLLLNAAIDKALRAQSAQSDGLIDVWNLIISEAGSEPFSEAVFIAALAQLGGPDLAVDVSEQVRSSAPDFDLSA